MFKSPIILSVLITTLLLGGGLYLSYEPKLGVLEALTPRTDAYGSDKLGMEILVRVGDKFSGENKTKGWQDGQIVDIRPLGFHTGKYSRQHFAVIELPNTDYWILRGEKDWGKYEDVFDEELQATTSKKITRIDWKSTSTEAMALKSYLSVKDINGKQAWESGYGEKVERIRDYFIDFRWLLDNGHITENQYFDIYDRDKTHKRISLDLTLEQLANQEDTTKRLVRLEDRRILTRLKKLIPTAQAITSGTYSIGAGLDYETVTAFEAAIEATLTGNLTGEHADEETAISTVVTFDTNTNGFLLKLTAASGAEHNGTFGNVTYQPGDGARINYGTSDNVTLDETNDGDLDDVEISKLVLDIRGTGNTGVTLHDGGNGGGLLLVNRMVIKGDAASLNGIRTRVGVANGQVTNNIVYDIGNSTGEIGINISTVSVTQNILIANNTSVKNYENIVSNDTGPEATNHIYKNNIAQGHTGGGDYKDDGSGFGTTANNISEDATSPDAAYQSKDLHTNSVFKDYANDDYRLAPAGDTTNLAILDDGEDLSGTFTDDIQGQTRDTWYIGASEIVTCASRPSSNYKFFKSITLESDLITTTTESTFAVLATTTDPDLIVGGSGHVEFTDGRDIAFFDDDKTTLLNHEIEKYDSSTGELVVWIQTDISSTTDKVIYMYYGDDDADEINSGCVRDTWNDNYVGVWHLGDFDATPATTTYPDFLDSTKFDNDGSSQNMVGGVNNLVSTSTIDGGVGFDGSDDYVDISYSSLDFLSATSEITLAAWIKTETTFDAAIFGFRDSGSELPVMDMALGFIGVGSPNTGHPGLLVRDSDGVGLTHIKVAQDLRDNTWHHVVATINSAKLIVFYIDGVARNSGTHTMASGITTDTKRIGDESENSAIENFDGTIDEVRISNTALTPQDISTQYNNQVAVSEFLTFGAEEGEVVSPEGELQVKEGVLRIKEGVLQIK